MKTFTYLILLSILISFTIACDHNSECDDDKPFCDDENCMECLESNHCPFDKYCDTLTDSKKKVCKSYDDDEVFGEFCNDDTGKCSSSQVCGKCTKDNKVLWTGSCIQFKCRKCQVGQHNSGIANDHDTAGCYPTGSYGSSGSLKVLQNPGYTPKTLSQSSVSIGWLCVGIIFFLILIVQLLLLRKSK
ncbi:hypothetical protein M0812_11326 [Anaeramoeba flamelloides]|uniref:TNFR-Cys domain-containing protein n=1 Tax=Anaeramoeba flamelloides TaxID=1746091 RepID=A0AAV7ZXC3_9EUKA|nr:hypothetical protein M0812_11326 [Anaeramoeba flamelloides]